jgi:predicted PurR-regulated permease PerM
VPTERGIGVPAARIGAALLLLAAALAVLRPFLTAIAWAAVLAYVTWPVFGRLRAHTRRPRLMAALFTLTVAVGVGFPIALLLVTLADQVASLVAAVRSWAAAGAPLPLWFTESAAGEAVHNLVTRAVDPSQTSRYLASVGTQLSGRLLGVAGGVARNVFQFGVTLVSLYAFYLGGERLVEVARRLAPLLFPVAPDRFLERIGASLRAVTFGLLGTAFAQGLLAGAGLAVAGVPQPVALGAATAFLSFLPFGAGAVPLGAAAWLGVTGQVGAAIGLALWSILVVSSMDNLLRPVLISGAGRIPFLLVFFGVIGGLGAFGLIGLFLGPVLLSVVFTLVAEFARQRSEEPATPEDAASGSSRGA